MTENKPVDQRPLQLDLPDDALEQARRDLETMLAEHVGRQRISKGSLQLAFDIVAQHYQWCRQQGLNFPELTIIALPAVQQLRLHPKDLSQEAKERIVVNLCREFGSSVPLTELAWAVTAAWPGFRPTVLSPLERRFKN